MPITTLPTTYPEVSSNRDVPPKGRTRAESPYRRCQGQLIHTPMLLHPPSNFLHTHLLTARGLQWALPAHGFHNSYDKANPLMGHTPSIPSPTAHQIDLSSLSLPGPLAAGVATKVPRDQLRVSRRLRNGPAIKASVLLTEPGQVISSTTPSLTGRLRSLSWTRV